ncbi:MAG TPA: response regulator [Thermomicrobiales bacterium]|nr:response regulator [Thermomicrobiales bacterium]
MTARILVVDDEPQIRRAVRAGLQANGFAVELAPSGDAALDAIALNVPDVVILDLGLPDIDGIEVVRQIREWCAAPIIVLSVREAERDKVAALDAGADDYLTKPFGMDELLARVRVALRHSASQLRGEPVLAFGDLRIDRTSRLVTVRDEEIHLTPTEYDLLCELAANAGRVLTHQMLLTRVWGPASADSTHYLRVYINQLRQKIEADPRRPRYLTTEPGVGYRFRAEPPLDPLQS